MKIEMGESLLYSWLRHVKECQVVQTNWKASPQWELKNREDISSLIEFSKDSFSKQLQYEIYKDISLEQFLMQAEIDVLGISSDKDGYKVYAIDVAFHEAGLNYGSREETVSRVVKKCLRSAACLIGYFDQYDGEIIFASPKINNAVIADMIPAIELANKVLRECKINFDVRIIANEDFESKIMSPILIASEGISDTSELFLRSYQMYKMFVSDTRSIKRNGTGTYTKKSRVNPLQNGEQICNEPLELSEMKIGQIARIVLRGMLENGSLSEDELSLMQTSEYSKEIFHINYPLLSKEKTIRYYKDPIKINGEIYYLCSEWYENAANNDRPSLINWIMSHN